MKFESKQRYFIHIVQGNEFITMSWYDFIMFHKKTSFRDMNVEIAQEWWGSFQSIGITPQ